MADAPADSLWRSGKEEGIRYLSRCGVLTYIERVDRSSVQSRLTAQKSMPGRLMRKTDLSQGQGCDAGDADISQVVKRGIAVRIECTPGSNDFCLGRPQM